MSTKKEPQKRWLSAEQVTAAIDQCYIARERFLREAETMEDTAQTMIRLAAKLDEGGKKLPVPKTAEEIQAALPGLMLDQGSLRNLMRGMGMGEFRKRDWFTREAFFISASWHRILRQHAMELRHEAGKLCRGAKYRRVRAMNKIDVEAKKLGEAWAVMKTEAMPFLPFTNEQQDISIPAA